MVIDNKSWKKDDNGGECAAASAGNNYDEHGVAGDNGDGGDGGDNGDGGGGGDNGDGGDNGGDDGGGGDVGDGDGDDGYPSPLPQLGLRPTHSPPENVQVKAISFFNVLKAKPPLHKN